MIALLAAPVVLVCLVAGALGLARLGWGLVRRRPARAARGGAIALVSLGIGWYAYGAVLVGLQDAEASHGTDSSPAPACQRDRPTVTGHRAGYLPLRFDCLRADGTTYAVGVSPWFTAAALGIAAAGAVAHAAARPAPLSAPEPT